MLIVVIGQKHGFPIKSPLDNMMRTIWHYQARSSWYTSLFAMFLERPKKFQIYFLALKSKKIDLAPFSKKALS